MPLYMLYRIVIIFTNPPKFRMGAQEISESMCSVIKCRIADATHMKVNTLFFADNDDDNDDIGDGDDFVGEDIDDIDDGSC